MTQFLCAADNATVDVYAFSMILFELLEGYIPFLSIHPVEAAKQAALENKRPMFDKQNRYNRSVAVVTAEPMISLHTLSVAS